MDMTLLKHPSAWLPIGMSLAGLALVVGHAAVYGIVHEADEAPGRAVRVMGLQALAITAAFASVYWLT